MPNISIFASGNGSNAINLISHFATHRSIGVNAVWCNRPGAPVIEKARAAGINTIEFGKKEFLDPRFTDRLQSIETHWIVLAGFLWLVPTHLTDGWRGKIINIHPALLPAYGGKGMYGHHVHEAVIADKCNKSGITIHLVDDHYDHGRTLFQATCNLQPGDTPDQLAGYIHQLEQQWFPTVVETLIEGGEEAVRQLSGNEAL